MWGVNVSWRDLIISLCFTGMCCRVRFRGEIWLISMAERVLIRIWKDLKSNLTDVVGGNMLIWKLLMRCAET
ncbi:hypothetical protein Hanom_Chr03g00233891 [Helianthus anomalus]